MTAVVLVVALAVALGGCGIRATSVPVDAGAAPSRVSCAVPTTAAPDSAGERVAQVYLVCSAQVSPVRRTMSATGGNDRLATARKLLDQLQVKPDADEAAAGFSSDVPGDLDVAGPRRGDPADALRLSQDQAQLPSFALAQIVCTFAGTAAGSSDGTVVFGFAREAKARRFACTGELRTLPEVAETAGTAVK
jgi:hypothetical protein